ncbi:MAG: ImmA/IrrE family metallo-endopeptidase [Candidatus Gracilibacteria bacterium]
MNYQKATLSAKQFLDKLKITKPPVDIRAVIRSVGIIVAEAPHEDDGMSGLILRGNGKTLIGLNASHHENRKRFTLAHELGHNELHSKGIFIDPEKNFNIKYRAKKNGGYDPEESEANAFAAELLMPEDWVKKDFDTLDKNFKSLGKEFIANALAKKYEVSDEAMNIRLDSLSLV